MEKERLKILRKEQFLNCNLGFIGALSVFFALLYLGISLRIIMVSLGIVTILILLFNKHILEMGFKLFPYKKELYIYEKEKLKEEWSRLNKISNASKIIVGIMMILLGLNLDFTISKDALRIMIFMMPLYLGLFNFNLFFHFRKIDNDDFLEGFTKNKLMFSIITGIVFTIFLVRIIFLIIK